MTSNMRERGSALLITMLVMVILTLLGLSYLFMADTENLIAQNQRDSDQLLFVAEGGARMVKAWFDRPVYGMPSDPNSIRFKFLNSYDFRNSAYFDRTQRIFDHDADPNTPDVAADGSTGRPYHRQGLTVDPNAPTYLSFFDKPYRGNNQHSFLGSEAGPDIVIQSNSLDPNASGTVDFLDQLNNAMFADQPNTGRIQRIDIYAPPVIVVNGTPTRFGIATVKVTSAKFRGLAKNGGTTVTTPTSRRMSERVVKMVLNEAAYPGPGGPLQSCTGLSTNGAFAVHWGATTSVLDASISTSVTQLKNRAPESVPWATQNSYISGAELSDPNTGYLKTRIGRAVADPWFQLISGGSFDPPLDPNAAPGNQVHPYPYDVAVMDDNSNMFAYSVVSCPEFDYDLWKQTAQSGFGDAHYFAPVPPGTSDLFQENGTGPAKTFAQWTKGLRGGLYFFDTKDGLTPEAGGGNLTGEVSIAASDDWAGGGFIYLNAENMRQTGIGADAVTRALIPPGEPYVDLNGNKVWETGEPYVNLTYTTTGTGASTIDPNGTQTGTATTVTGEVFRYTTSPGRDDQGIPITETINWYGVIYTSGTWDAQGNGKFFGSVVTRNGVLGGTSGSPDVWFDERLVKGMWPPPDLDMPRTMITVWQTDL